jgi:ferric-dicitrate binding protein FerR (iron transport regulator)
MKTTLWNIIAKYLFNEKLNKQEQIYIDTTSNNAEGKKSIDEAKNTQKKLDSYFALGNYNTNTAWEKVNNQTLSTPVKAINARNILRYAAIFLLLVSLSILIWQQSNIFNQPQHFSVAKTDISHPELLLSDQSLVKLNHSSELVYRQNLGKKSRIVSLNGEAFFTVSPDKERPFIIETHNARIKVVGTAFNVNAYPNSPNVTVMVQSGTVELIHSNKNSESAITLHAGQQGILNKASGELIKLEQIEQNGLSWLHQDIAFDKTPLYKAISTIENVYGIEIETDPNIDINQLITATFNQHQSKYILETVALTLNLELTQTNQNSFLLKAID